LFWNWGQFQEASEIAYEDDTAALVDEPITMEQGLVKMTHSALVGHRRWGGGPWLVGSDPLSTERNFILSIDSYRLDDDGVSYGPYFDDRFKSLFDFVEKGCK